MTGIAAETLIYRARSFDPRDREVALHRLHHAIGLGRGPVVVTGGPGSGKTDLCRAIAKQVEGATFTALVLGPVASEEDLVERMLRSFGIVSDDSPFAGSEAHPVANASRRLDTLHRFLSGLTAIDATATLIVDDAQNLPAGALARTARLASLDATEAPLQIVLVGEPKLRDILRSAELAAFERRVSTRLELEPPDRVSNALPIRPRRTAIAAAIIVAFLGSAFGAGLTAYVYQRFGF